MMKASIDTLMPVYEKIFNSILNQGTMPQTWCGGLITPIYKSGGRSDPANYQGICVSSCLGKLFCSVLNQRLLEYIVSLNILQKSQIGFLPNNRTADHAFTLRTLIDKYVHNHNEKIYACFVDFKKAFESVWHDGLLNELLQIDVGGSFYNLIKSLYHNSSCSIKIAQKQGDHSVMRKVWGKAVSKVHCFLIFIVTTYLSHLKIHYLILLFCQTVQN